MPVQGQFVPAHYFPSPQGYPANVYAGYGMMNPAMPVGYQQPALPQADPQNNPALLLQMLRESDYPSQREWAADQLTIQRDTASSLTPDARSWLAEHGYDPHFGARPMARLVDNALKKPLAEALLFGNLRDGGEAHVEVSDDKLVVRCAVPAPV